MVETDSSITMSQIDGNGTVIGDVEVFTKDENENIVYVDKNNHRVTTCTYDSENRMASIEDDSGHKLVFTYGGEEDFRVASVQEYQGSSAGAKVSYDRHVNTCVERSGGANGNYGDSDDLYTTYSFDNACRLICTQAETLSEKLGSFSYEYDENGELERIANKGRISDNLFKNHNIESTTNWSPGPTTTSPSYAGSATYDANERFVGNGSIKITTTDFGGINGYGVSQNYTVGTNNLLQVNKTYVASAYVKINGTIQPDSDSVTPGDSCRNYGACILAKETITGQTYTNNVYGETLKTTNGNWERIYTYFTVPENCTSIKIYLQIRNGTGTAYFDAAQLELGSVPNEYNMLEDNSFNLGLSNWTKGSQCTADDSLTNGNMHFLGNVSKKKCFYQDIPLKGASQDDTYIVSAVGSGYSAAIKDSRRFDIRAQVYFHNSETDTTSTDRTNAIAPFCVYNNGAQYVQASFNLKAIVSTKIPYKIRIYVFYAYNVNTADIESISLVKSNDVFETKDETETNDEGTYTYNPDGTIATYTDADGNVTTYTYTNGVLTREETKNSSNQTIYLAVYNTSGEITSETDESGNVTTYTYTGSGDNRYLSRSETKNSVNTVIAYINYNSSGNTTSQLSEGIVSSYTYDSNGNVLTETVDGTTTTYTYNSDGKVHTKSKSGHTITYGYPNDKLTSVSTGTATYNYTYDAWGRNTTIKQVTQNLESYSYNKDGAKTQTTSGNGNTETYSYNGYGQLSKITQTGVGSYSFINNSKGVLVQENDSVNSQRTYYKYDGQGRKVGEHIVSTTQYMAYYNELYGSDNELNENGEVTKNTVSSKDSSAATTYTRTDLSNNRKQVVSQVTGSRKVTNIYSSEGQLTSKTFNTDTAFTQSYTYNDKGNIATETSGSDTFSYTYDKFGRITAIRKNNTLRQSYVYDALGQLTRENNLDTNKTTVYTYNSGGNITKKQIYAYTTGTVGTVQSTINYTYPSSGWQDRLSSYNGETCSYDAIGNPTTYRGATCTYFGHQLKSYAKSGTTVSYKYDSDGLRTCKTVNGVNHDYYYVDGMLMYEKHGNEYELFYRYDNDGRPQMVLLYNIARSAWYKYCIITNAQGDITKLISGAGNVSVTYTYDAWGNITSFTDTSSTYAQIGTKMSLLYRGYVYDRETGLYYLQSRYYDPQAGRFISSDQPEYIGANDDFGGWNSFSYCENEPVDCIDPDGNITINIKTIYTRNTYIGYHKNPLNEDDEKRYAECFIFETSFNKKFSYSEFGSKYFNAFVYFFRKKDGFKDDVKIDLKMYSDISKNKLYMYNYVKNNFTKYLSAFIVNQSKRTFQKSSFKNKSKVELEILLHIYMYYFGLDANNSYKNSSIINLGGEFWEQVAMSMGSVISLEKDTRNAIIKKKENKVISAIIKRSRGL